MENTTEIPTRLENHQGNALSGVGLSECACVCVYRREERKLVGESFIVRAVDIYMMVEMMPFQGGRTPFPWKCWLCPCPPNPRPQVMHPVNLFWCGMVYDLAMKNNTVIM